MRAIATPLACGNTVVLKPSDTTPESTLVLARISKGILPDGVCLLPLFLDIRKGTVDEFKRILSHMFSEEVPTQADQDLLLRLLPTAGIGRGLRLLLSTVIIHSRRGRG